MLYVIYILIFATFWTFTFGNITSPESIKKMDGPSHFEILLPPIFLLLGGALGLTILWLYTKLSLKNSKRPSLTNKVQNGSVNSFTKIAWNEELSKDDIISAASGEISRPGSGTPASEFYSRFDEETLNTCRTFQNGALELLRISAPATVSLIICPITLFLHKPLVKFFWPSYTTSSLPNINESIACFLAPAGMVYAVSFGFAFQQVLGKQMDVTRKIVEEVGQIDQLMSLTSKLQTVSIRTKLLIYKRIKSEIIYMIQQLTSRSTKSLKVSNSDIWNIVDLLREMPAQHTVDTAISHRIVKYISCLNNASDKVSSARTRMHPLQWVFLEMLGYFSFLGVLLVQAQSYRMELAMCIITVTSISMLCYVVSDLDAPFHGFFRIDLSILEAVMCRLETLYTADCTCNTMMEEELMSKKITGVKFESTESYTI